MRIQGSLISCVGENVFRKLIKEFSLGLNERSQKILLEAQAKHIKSAEKWCHEQSETEINNLKGEAAVAAKRLWLNLFKELTNESPSVKVVDGLKKESLKVLSTQEMVMIENFVTSSQALKNIRLLDGYKRSLKR